MRNEIIGQIYTATFEEVAITAAQDLFELGPGNDMILVLHSVSISQSSDAGDTQSEMFNILYHRGRGGSGGTTISTAGSTPGPPPTQLGDNDGDVTVKVNNTVQASKGTTLRRESFNILLGYEWSPCREAMIWVHPDATQALVISLETTPADSVTLSGTVVFELIGDWSFGG